MLFRRDGKTGSIMTTYVISRRVTRPTLVGPMWFDEMCEGDHCLSHESDALI